MDFYYSRKLRKMRIQFIGRLAKQAGKKDKEEKH